MGLRSRSRLNNVIGAVGFEGGGREGWQEILGFDFLLLYFGMILAEVIEV